jgi:hypothetical protein
MSHQLARVEFPTVLEDGLNRAILDTGALPCDGQVRSYAIANPYEHPIYIRKVRRWIGTSLTSIMDVNSNLFTNNPYPQPVFDGPWDRYGDPSQPHTESEDFDPFILLVAGGWLTMNVSATKLQGECIPPQYHSPTHHHGFWIYFVKDRP